MLLCKCLAAWARGSLNPSVTSSCSFWPADALNGKALCHPAFSTLDTDDPVVNTVRQHVLLNIRNACTEEGHTAHMLQDLCVFSTLPVLRQIMLVLASSHSATLAELQ